jgi:hypothetical protein
MRYMILRPSRPTDPRHLGIESTPHLHEVFPPTVECSLEEEAVEAVRLMYPDAVAMPVPFRIGSGDVYLLGILENISARPPSLDGHDIDGVTFPFVLLVHALAVDALDRRTNKERKQFTSRLWQAPVVDPTENVSTVWVELRASDLPNPVRTKAVVGERDGRLTIRCSVGGVAMSITFEAPDAVVTAQGHSSRRAVT